METTKFTEKILIGAKPEQVFDFTQDYNRRLEWDTFLKKAVLLDGAAAAGKGIKTYCLAKNRLGMETVYLTFNRPKATAIKMTKGPFMFRAFLASWTFNAALNDRTEVVFLYSFTLRFPFSLFTKIIKSNLQNNVKQRLADLK